MAGGTFSRADAPRILEPGLKELFIAEYELGGETYSKYWDVETSEKAVETFQEMIIPSEVPRVSEGGMYPSAELKQGRTATAVHYTYKLEIKMTEEVQEDNLYGAAIRTQKDLAIAMKRTVEKLSATTFCNGLSSEVTPDGKLVFAPDHIVLTPQGNNPTSWSNVNANDPFSSIGIKNLKTLMKKQRDENGELCPHRMNQLIVPTDLEEEALEMLKAKGTYDRADMAPNQVASGLEVIAVDHFDDANHQYKATNYFGRDSRKAMNKFLWRVKPEYKLVYEEATGNLIQRVRARFSLVWVNPRGVVAAYS